MVKNTTKKRKYDEDERHRYDVDDNGPIKLFGSKESHESIDKKCKEQELSKDLLKIMMEKVGITPEWR